ncbi:MAG TPA: hypothetical protein VK760_08045 [Candidatus Acidoferrales bacterium]|jgi:hypothetical protein|nr:hypothetical protein [Candidatus Acidoferrales bacterium]
MRCRPATLALAAVAGSLAFALAMARPASAQAAGAASPAPPASASPAASPSATPADLSTEDMQEASQSVDPLAPKRAFTIEDENTQSVAGPNNQVNLVGQIPLTFNPPFAEMLAGGHALSFVRLKLPIVTTSPTNSGVDAITGTGDLTVSWLAGFGTARSRWAAGAVLKFPTGSGALGSGKWSAGPALGYTYEVRRWTFGVYTATSISYAGTRSRPPLAQTQITPSITYAFADGWSVGNSDMQYTYDYYQREFTNLPVGLRVAKRYKLGKQRASTYFEWERNLTAVGGTSVTMRLGTRFIFGP